MPYDDPDPTDPNILIGVELATDMDATIDMAYAFAEEFSRLGFKKERLMSIFRRPFYIGAHRAYLELGDEAIEKIVDECVSIWGKVRIIDRESTAKQL